jgi:hypothetical protein
VASAGLAGGVRMREAPAMLLGSGLRRSEDGARDGPDRIAPAYNKVRGGDGEMARRKAMFPNRKISKTFLRFAAPLLYNLPSKAPEQQAREALRLSFTAWNAVIFADVLNDDRYLNEIRRVTADKPEAAVLMDQMIVRKRTLFANDARLIGSWEVTQTEDGINLRADARDPHSLPRNPTDKH